MVSPLKTERRSWFEDKACRYGCPRVIANLRRLFIMNQKITTMVGVGVCHTLEELWIWEGDIEVRPVFVNCTTIDRKICITPPLEELMR